MFFFLYKKRHQSQFKIFLLSLLAVKQAVAVTVFVRRVCVHACVCASVRILRAITPTFMPGFQSYLTLLLSLRRRNVV